MADTKKFGCQHYERNCAFISPCCNKMYKCRVCHNEAERHEINRQKVTEIQCLHCHKVQPVSNTCIKCDTTFGKYFCSTCRLYDDDTSKGQFHCDKCGICRVGGKEKFFHCDKCDSCLSNSLKGSHKCVEKGTRTNCPICLEDMHTSRTPIQVPRCGHFIHMTCLEDMIKNGNYACGLCGESLQNMSAVWEILDREVADTPMPPEYREFYVQVLCKDCHKESRTLFHIVGLKCHECGSYNTCRAAEPASSDQEDSSHSVTQTNNTASPQSTNQPNDNATDQPTTGTNQDPTRDEASRGEEEADELLRV